MESRAEIRKKMPHGSCKKIAERAQVTQKSVSDFFSGKTDSERIAIAAIEVLNEIKTKKNDLNKKLLIAVA